MAMMQMGLNQIRRIAPGAAVALGVLGREALMDTGRDILDESKKKALQRVQQGVQQKTKKTSRRSISWE